MSDHEDNQRFTGLVSAIADIDLYGIPITFFSVPSRIPMRRVTPSGDGKAVFFARPRFKSRPPSAFKHPLPTGKFFARSIPMMDVVMLAIGIVFFALSIGYVYACDRL
jgi:hypothetical protein